MPILHIGQAHDLQTKAQALHETASKLLDALAEPPRNGFSQTYGQVAKSDEKSFFEALGERRAIETRLVRKGRLPDIELFLALDLVDNRLATPRTVKTWYLNRFLELRLEPDSSAAEGVVLDLDRGASVQQLAAVFLEAMVMELPDK